MNLDEIKALAEIMCQNSLTRVEVEVGEKKLCMERQSAVIAAAVQKEATVQADSECSASQKELPVSGAEAVKSPIVGVFYASPAPDSDPYVKVGSKVKKGDVLCVIEAMKLLNEITADMDGEVVAVCATNGEMVEYGQTLFEIV